MGTDNVIKLLEAVGSTCEGSMNKYIQEITDHITRSIPPEDANKLTNRAQKDTRMAMIELSTRLDGMYHILFYGDEQGRNAKLGDAAARLSLCAAALAFKLSKEAV
jgi:hypothetical protein